MTTQSYNITAEIDTEFGEGTAEALLAPIADHHGAAARSELGRAEVVFTIAAETVRQATTTALAILETYPWALHSMRVVPTADYDRLADIADLPSLLSVQEAATRLGISRQAVTKAIAAGTLPAIRVGSAWIVRESSVAARTPRGA